MEVEAGKAPASKEISSSPKSVRHSTPTLIESNGANWRRQTVALQPEPIVQPVTPPSATADEAIETGAVSDAALETNDLFSPEPVTPVTASSHRKWIALVIPAAVLAIACGLFFVFNSRRSSAEPSPVSQIEEGSSSAPAAESQPLPSPETVTEPPDRLSVPGRRSASSPAPITTVEPMPAQKGDEVKFVESPSSSVWKEPSPIPTPVVPSPASRLPAEDHLNQGITKLNAGDFQEAVGEFEKARRLAPGNADLYYLIGQAHHRMGRPDQALAAYRQCTSGVYAAVAQNHVRTLEMKMNRSK